MTELQPAARVRNRWSIAIAGTALQLCLGTVYSWSYFQNPLVKAYQWSNAQAAAAFSIAICFLGIAAAWGGVNLARFGPRKLAVTGGLLFGGGYLVSALALSIKSLWLFYLGYGVIGGIGLGLGYVTPVATAARWFPDKKGLVTGMVVMGFGFGALLMSKVIAPVLVAVTRSEAAPDGDFVMVFFYIGLLFTVVTPLVAAMLANPPAGFAVGGKEQDAAQGATSPPAGPGARSCIFSLRFAMMWLVFFCNIAAGIAIISFQSPLLQDLWRKIDPDLDTPTLAGYGATLIAVSSLFNGAGRFLWGALSDRVGRANSFRAMLVTQIAAFVALIFVSSPWAFGALICYILLCYGGGFGTMPSFVADVFGARLMAVIYGAILTAWSVAGIVGPQVFGHIKDKLPLETASTWSFALGAGILAIGLLAAVVFLSDRPCDTDGPAM